MPSPQNQPSQESYLSRLRQLITENHLDSMADDIVASAKPSIRLLPSRETEATPLAFSRLGGLPQMPASLSWPEVDDQALSFLAQIQLSELQGLDLPPECPRAGRLYFFCVTDLLPPSGWEIEEAGEWRVLFVADESESLVDWPAQPGMNSQELFDPIPLALRRDLTIPATRSIELSRLPEMRNEVWENYFSLLGDVADAGPRHRMFGHPDAIQGCMQRTAQFISRGETLPEGVHNWYEHPRAAELMPGAHDWLLLLQIDSDYDVPNFSWGDAGSLYFWIQREDLAARRFDKVWFFMQCG